MTQRTLYRDTQNRKIAGVCAGVADYFGIETWFVRVLAVTAALLGAGFFVVIIYIAMSLMVEKKPYQAGDFQDSASPKPHKVKSKPWQTGESPSQLIASLEGELADVEKKVKTMEAHVTSDTFNVEREFSKL
ncbi:envelope stress response membrane protein PspC [Vibrio sp. SCSIO 43136]|uniref:envelope stress response membrane protein PspC n=1 Tax=Vibrio sp. SCSIO 43136 TaxID=2819101 RepID=UPI00207542FB|nr:envelope stress response membrane protein PspC [Vibrio sp. SCSIO 43136]USD66302.1 envelope stress response membrane protein PspC [Vibrio sp. SCSIO 43136]